QLAGLINVAIPARAWGIEIEYREGIALDGVETAFTNADRAVVGIGLADLELEIAAAELLVETLDRVNDLPSGVVRRRYLRRPPSDLMEVTLVREFYRVNGNFTATAPASDLACGAIFLNPRLTSLARD